MSWVTVKVPCAPEPLACMRRSGITSRAKWASFSISQTSCNSAGPRGPAVWMLKLSVTGVPDAWDSGGRLESLLIGLLLRLDVEDVGGMIAVRAGRRLCDRCHRRRLARSGLAGLPAPGGSSDDAAKIAAAEVRILIRQHVGLDVAEGRLRFVLDTVVEGLDDVFLEMRRTRMCTDHRLALGIAVFGISQAKYVHFDARRQERDDRVHVLRDAGRRVQC